MCKLERGVSVVMQYVKFPRKNDCTGRWTRQSNFNLNLIKIFEELFSGIKLHAEYSSEGFCETLLINLLPSKQKAISIYIQPITAELDTASLITS